MLSQLYRNKGYDHGPQVNHLVHITDSARLFEEAHCNVETAQGKVVSDLVTKHK